MDPERVGGAPASTRAVPSSWDTQIAVKHADIHALGAGSHVPGLRTGLRLPSHAGGERPSAGKHVVPNLD